MTFEATLLIGVAHAFGTVEHVQWSVKSVRMMVKRMLKEFEDVTSVMSRTEHEDVVIS